MADPVVIEDYDPNWPQLFETLRSQLALALTGLASSIDHVGSTAVPGLAAKPIIDIDVLLRSSAKLPEVIRQLETLGYEYQGDLGVRGRDVFRAKGATVRHHLYVHAPASHEYARHVAFRNHLRTHAEDARAYAALKREAASKFGADRQAYTDAKSAFMQHILDEA